jgi:hypothetical protein
MEHLIARAANHLGSLLEHRVEGWAVGKVLSSVRRAIAKRFMESPTVQAFLVLSQISVLPFNTLSRVRQALKVACVILAVGGAIFLMAKYMPRPATTG